MVDFPRRIDPFEHVKIQKTKPSTEEEKKKEPLVPKLVSKKMFLYMTLLKIVSNLLSKFTSKQTKNIKRTPLHKELLTIKSSLQALKDKNLCQDGEFLNFFAYIWMKFFKDQDLYNIRNEEITSLINQLVEEIHSYPKNSEFSLAYYVTEFAGYKWVPFPYMDILQNLYLENKKEPEFSHLNKWIGIINELLRKV